MCGVALPPKRSATICFNCFCRCFVGLPLLNLPRALALLLVIRDDNQGEEEEEEEEEEDVPWDGVWYEAASPLTLPKLKCRFIFLSRPCLPPPPNLVLARGASPVGEEALGS